MNEAGENGQGISRRGFLLLSAGAVGALVLPHGVAQASDARGNNGFAELTCGKDGTMKKRVLVAYASRCGSTGGVAETVGQALCGMGASVDVRLVGNVKELSAYQAVVVGGAIRMGRWLPEAAEFVKNRQEELSRLPCAYFVACLTMRDDTNENRRKVGAYLDAVRKESPKVQPASVGLFGGAVDFSKLGFGPKTMLKVMGAPEGDYRNWPAIKAWANDAGRILLA